MKKLSSYISNLVTLSLSSSIFFLVHLQPLMLWLLLWKNIYTTLLLKSFANLLKKKIWEKTKICLVLLRCCRWYDGICFFWRSMFICWSWRGAKLALVVGCFSWRDIFIYWSWRGAELTLVVGCTTLFLIAGSTFSLT